MHSSCELSRRISCHISLGRAVSLERDVWLNVLEGYNDEEPAIILEDGVKFGRRTVLSAKNRIHIKPNTICGPSALIMDHNLAFDNVTVPISRQGPSKGGTILIEEGCWIGFGAVVLCDHGELVIGRNSVVGANAVLTRSVPAYSVVSGNPARIVKHFDLLTGKWVLGSSWTKRSGDPVLEGDVGDCSESGVGILRQLGDDLVGRHNPENGGRRPGA